MAKTKNKKSRIIGNLKKTQKKLRNILWAPIDTSLTDRFIFSCFSGVGGFDRGGKKAGFQPLFQSDWWLPAGKAFDVNIKNENSDHNYLKSEGVYYAGPKTGDITKLTFDRVRKSIQLLLKVSIRPGDIAVMVGGPPCQDYSRCNNHKKINGTRNHLIFPYLRLIDSVKPKVALVEQVPDLLSPKFRHIWMKIRLALNSMTDYTWNYKIMNAKNYGSRQDRKRLIIMLVRRDLNVPVSFPEPTAPDLTKVAVQRLLPHVYHFSPGQYADGIKSAMNNIFCTMTASGSEYFYGANGVRYKPPIKDRLVLTELEGLNLTGIPETSQKKLVGNMVQISFAEALFLHIKKHILKLKD